MSIHVPVYVNDKPVGRIVITRIENPPGNQEEWRTHRYDVVVYQYSPDGRTFRETVWHQPDQGIWKLIATACAKVPGWAMR